MVSPEPKSVIKNSVITSYSIHYTKLYDEEYKKTIEELGAHLASLEKSLGKEYTNPIDWKTLKENDWAYGMRVSYSSSQDGSPYVEFQGMTVRNNFV